MRLTSRAVAQQQQGAGALTLTRPVQPAIPFPFRAMALHHLASLAAITAGVTAAAAPSTLGVELSPVTVTLLSIAGTLAVGWGVMRTSVAALQRETQTLRQDFYSSQETQHALLREALERIARIEGALGK
jgi:hypothetical protein